MNSDLKLRQEKEWKILNKRIDALLSQFGQKDAFGEGDFWLLDDNWGRYRQEIEVQNLELLRPGVIQQLRVLLEEFPDWDVTVRVDVPEKRGEWPGMGLVVSRDKISDELRREFLPLDFRNIAYD